MAFLAELEDGQFLVGEVLRTSGDAEVSDGFQGGVQEKVKWGLFRTVKDYSIQNIVWSTNVEQDGHLFLTEPCRSPTPASLALRRGLLKVEQLHALARAVYYGQRGRISAREVYDQVSACSCLTLILACIVYWRAREISRIAAAPDFPFDPDLLRHVSPIEWKNVILYGEIKIDPAKLKLRQP